MPSVIKVGPTRWKVTISLGEKSATGGYHRTYRTVTAPNKTQALRAAQALESDLRARSATLSAERATFAEVAEAWWEEFQLKDRKGSTRDRYEVVMRLRVRGGPLADRRIRELRPAHFDSWYLRLGQTLGPATIRLTHCVVRQVLTHAVRNGWLIANPAADAQLPEGNTEEARRLGLEELEAALVVANERHPARARALFFAALTGLRVGEVAAVRWSHVDTEGLQLLTDPKVGNVIWVRGEGWIATSPKSGRGEMNPIDEAAAAIVRQQQEWQLAEARGTGSIDSDPYLWAMRPPFGTATRPGVISGWWTAAAAGAGVEGVSFHGLRHFAGSELGDTVGTVAGASRADVQRLLRHVHPATTDRYLHARRDFDVRRRMLDARRPVSFPGTVTE